MHMYFHALLNNLFIHLDHVAFQSNYAVDAA